MGTGICSKPATGVLGALAEINVLKSTLVDKSTFTTLETDLAAEKAKVTTLETDLAAEKDKVAEF